MWEEEYMDLDPAFAERDRTRKAGLPVMIAETERLIIREIVPEDVPRLFEIFHQPGVENIVQPQQTLEEELEFMLAYIAHAYSFFDYGLWTVLKKEDGEIIGEAGLFPSERAEHGVELGYVIDPAFQRQGFGTESGKAVLEYAFHTLDLEVIHLFATRENQASLRTAYALGFRRAEETGESADPVHLQIRADVKIP